MKTIFLSLVLSLTFISYACATPTQLITSSTEASWTAPTTNVDGSPLINLAGFRFYCAATAGSQSDAQRYDIPDAVQVNVIFINIPWLTDADIYCRVTAYNVLGNESDWSNEIVRVIGNEKDVPGSTTGLIVQP